MHLTFPTGQFMKLRVISGVESCKFAAIAFISLAITTTAYSASVTVTAELTRLTMGAFYDSTITYRNQLAVNGANIDICGIDPACTSAIHNPSDISFPISGNAVSFGYDTARSPGSIVNIFRFSNSTQEVRGVGSDNKFKLGSVTFSNGQFYPLAFIDFTLTTHSIDPAFDNHSMSATIRLDVNATATPRDPYKEADYFTIQDGGGNILTSLGSVRVFDNFACPTSTPIGVNCNTGSAEIYGHINSLHLDNFANPTGGAFLNPSVTPSISPVPEPASLLMCLLGIFVVSNHRFRKLRHIL